MAGDTFYQFCGNSSIFNSSLLLESEWPEFTACFRKSVLVWVPCGWLWLTLPLYLSYLYRLPTGLTPPWSALAILKTTLSVLLSITCICRLIREVSDDLDKHVPVAGVVYVSGVLQIVTFLLAAWLTRTERLKHIVTSGVQWIFWLLLCVTGIVPFYTFIKQRNYEEDLVLFSLFYLYYAIVLVQFILHCFADTPNTSGYQLIGENPSPEVTASFPSRLTFWWINKLVLLAYRKGLTQDDLYDLHPRDQSSRVVPDFQGAWDRELERARLVNRKRQSQSSMERHQVLYGHHHHQPLRQTHHHHSRTTEDKAKETTPLMAKEARIEESPGRAGDTLGSGGGKKAKASLFKVLVKTYWWDMAVCSFFKLIYDLLQFLGPQLLDVLIAYTKNKDSEPEWKGYVFAVSFFLVSLTGSVFYHQHFHVSMTLGMRVKSACISTVYRKALTMSNEARKGSTVGEIVNLMSVDCQRLQEVTGFLYALWSSPLITIISLYLLWQQLGASVLAGLAFMVLLIPINAVVALKLRKLQVEQMKLKDVRLKLMNEVLSGMKVLKLYAWEESFEQKVTEVRNKELVLLTKAAYLNAFSTFVWTCAPFLVTLATFATYVLSSEDHYLDAGKAFVSLSLFNILRQPILLVPMIISFMTQAQVSVMRLGNFLRSEDLRDDCVQYDNNSDSAVTIQEGVFTWERNAPLPTLNNIQLTIPTGQLVAVVGQVGSGKSSLLSAILGEMEKVQGRVVTLDRVAYVPQQAWIQNSTLKDNILFGTSDDDQRYNEVLEACALKPDLDILPAGDKTEIGEKGINLSGGQKQRVSLARAVYHDADLYLLDDPLSAVDSHVGKHIFHHVIGSSGVLRGKTRVLVTHGVHWLPMVDKIVVMDKGRIREVGSYEELLGHDGQFAQFLKAYLTQPAHAGDGGGKDGDGGDDDDDEEEEDEEIQQMKARILERVDSVTSDSAVTSDDERGRTVVTIGGKQITMPRKRRKESQKEKERQDKKEKEKEKEKDRLTEDEKSETGKVQLSVFATYFRAIGTVVTLIILLLYTVYNGLSVYSSIWLSQWTDDDLLANTSLANTSRYQDKNYMYLGVYGGLGVGQALLVWLYSILATTRMVTAAGVLHTGLLYSVVRAPMAFFDTTPSGRIVNRFSSDIAIVDNNLPQTLRQALNRVLGVLSTFIVISYSTPVFLVVIIPLAVLYYLVQKFYIPTSRQLRRIESTTRSPIFNHFTETITGASSIRAYKAQSRFVEESKVKVDTNLKFYFFGIASNRWLGFRLEFVGNLVVLSAAMFAVITPDLDSGLVGLSVSYAMQITGSLNWMVRMVSDLETNIVSVERIKEYSETAPEAPWRVRGKRPPNTWPNLGSVQFVNYSTRYRPDLDLVLKALSCQFKGGEKVGIVGRTGAGKSSMTLALFRIIEAATGSILIDNLRISDMGLHDLRSRITVLPQDPVLFSGSLRSNLDPFDLYSDEQVWRALELAHLKDFVTSTPLQLAYECGEGGENLSVGQRQLVCLARSLLRKTKILVLDEATAAVDMATDELIQETIRSQFSDCTIITIAHRLNTIMDYDRIVVMDRGEIAEFDSPTGLLNNTRSVFYSMAKDAGLV